MKKAGLFLATLLLVSLAFTSCKKENAVTTNVTLNNPAFTDIYVTINKTTDTITPGSSVTFNSVRGSSVPYSAFTNGVSVTGEQIGLTMTWSGSLSLNGDPATYDLNISKDYFFIYMTNNGTHILQNLYVNYGLPSQTLDNIKIDTDGVQYPLGYYEAYDSTKVRMYWQDQPGNYASWNQGRDFTFQYIDNQCVKLSNSQKSEKSGTISESKIIPALSYNYKKDPHVIGLYCN